MTAVAGGQQVSQVREIVIGGEFVEGMIWFTIWKDHPGFYMENGL